MKRLLSVLAVAGAIAWATYVTSRITDTPPAARQGFDSLGGGTLGGGGGISKVTNSGGILSGSGTVTNPETATITVAGPVTGTGSSGSALTSSGDISAVTTGSGLGGGATSGAATVYVNAGSGVTADSSSTRVNEGSGLTWCSGAACVGQGSGMTIDAASIRTNLAGGTAAAGSDISSIDRYGAVTFGTKAATVTAGSGMTISPTTGAVVAAVNAGSGLTADGTNVRANLGAQMTFSAGAIQPALTGGACTGGAVVTNVSSVGATTCTVVTPNDYTGTVEEHVEEFAYEGIGATGNYFTSSSAGTAALAVVADTTSARESILGMTATSATGRQGLRSPVNGFLLGGGARIVDWIISVITLDDGTDKFVVEVGMLDTLNLIDQADGCYFAYDRSNVLAAPTTGAGNSSNLNKWACMCASNNTRTEYVMDGSVVSDSSFTTVNAPVTAATYNNLEVQINSASNEADFYVAGVKSCVITTHMPTGASRFTNYAVNIIKSAGTNLREVDLDRFRSRFTMNSARTP